MCLEINFIIIFIVDPLNEWKVLAGRKEHKTHEGSEQKTVQQVLKMSC